MQSTSTTATTSTPDVQNTPPQPPTIVLDDRTYPDVEPSVLSYAPPEYATVG